jgi:hypothetical protein
MCTMVMSSSAILPPVGSFMNYTGIFWLQYLDEPWLEVAIHDYVISIALVAVPVRYHHRRHRLYKHTQTQS